MNYILYWFIYSSFVLCWKLWIIILYLIFNRGMQWHSWLRHCTASQKVAASIPNRVSGIFHWHNPSGHRSTQHLTETNTSNIFCGYRWPVHRPDKCSTFMWHLSWNLGASTFCDPQGLSRFVQGLLYLTFTLIFNLIHIVILLLFIVIVCCETCNC